MLVLGRKPGQYIIIDNSVIVKVIKSDKGDLRLAIQAPKEVSITRGEVYAAKEVRVNRITK
ncbi:MAG: carbon storage regulator [Firmicutes bacterium]|nr:carbon storage regulator [Bacillota bacterium]